MKYAITINEVLSRTVVVNADNIDDAYTKVVNAYDKGNIVLDGEDYYDTYYEHDEYDPFVHYLCEVIE